MNHSNPWQYVKDWHHCVRCGCLMPDRDMRYLHRKDPLLNLDEHVWACTDLQRCARFKEYRDHELKRDADAVLKRISVRPVKSRAS